MKGVLEMTSATIWSYFPLQQALCDCFRWALGAGSAASDTKSLHSCVTQVLCVEQERKTAFLDVPHHYESSFVLELGKEEEKVFDPNSLDADRCESCYGAESEDIR